MNLWKNISEKKSKSQTYNWMLSVYPQGLQFLPPDMTGQFLVVFEV